MNSEDAFDVWLEDLKERRLVPFGTAYEIFARKAWQAGVQWHSENIREELLDVGRYN